MKRLAMEKLITWKNTAEHKPLLILGARQVGKTWLMKEFGVLNYKNTIYLNFEEKEQYKLIFDIDFDVERIITSISLLLSVQINAKDTLIIFDEIQQCPRALTSLKYFCENGKKYDIIAGGSLLGIGLSQESSFPVGKVSFLNLFPLSFQEFLLAKKKDNIVKIIKSKNYNLVKTLKPELEMLLKEYFFLGGMPEVINKFLRTNSLKAARDAQNDILNSYENDFSRHMPIEILKKARLLWDSIPSQLSKENKKFIYGAVKKGSRAKDFENSLSWLKDAGIIYQVHRVTKPGIPISSYEDFSAFKLFIVDIGLLGALVGLEGSTIFEENKLFEEFKGALTEQFTLQEFKANGNIPIMYFASDTSRLEIDFLIQVKGKVIPIEVKSTINLNAKSLKSYREKYSPEYAIRISLADYKVNDGLIDLPLYCISNIESEIK